jgi:hypothetical protein
MARTKSGSNDSRFKAAAKVRVKHGVRDPDFADVPLGGWAGIVKQVERTKGETTYLIAWDRATLKGMHPVYKKRCERDGLELGSMWLSDEDLEADDGTHVSIEPPTAIITKPLSDNDQDDRVRMALGLTYDDPLPDVTRKTLLDYYRHLKDKLKLPFKARSEADGSSLTVHRLPDPKAYDMDEEEGLLCEARSREGPFDVPLAELDEAGSGNRKLVGDYGYWFGNYR